MNRSSKPIPDDLTSALESASKKQELAQKRFEIAFEERKAIRDKITALEQTVRQAKASLTKLTGAESAADSAIGAASDTPTATPTAPPSTPALGTPQNDPDSSTDTTTTSSVPLPGPAGAAASLAQSAASTNQARQAADAKRQEVEKALRHEKFLESPLHPQNLLRWVGKHAPKVIGIVVLMIIANLLIRLLTKRIVGIVARTSAHGTPEEGENRAHTLVGVFRSSASLAVIASGFVMILDECGVPVGPLLGGAAIVGLAVAFGAQRLISDFFHGFVILLENQYKVNDVIRVAGIAGLVERISLRITVLRDLEGCLHFVPNGEIKSVTNMTHGWSRALFEIGVAYKEDADHVMEVLMELAHELRKDAKFGPLILEDPQMLGVDAMADSAIIKFFIKTRPLQQWGVKREMLRRIKRRFDELGIEIPSPTAPSTCDTKPTPRRLTANRQRSKAGHRSLPRPSHPPPPERERHRKTLHDRCTPGPRRQDLSALAYSVG